MGSGCYYTHTCNKERAAWIDLPPSQDANEDFEENDYPDYVREDLENLLTGNGYEKAYSEPCDFYNGLFDIFLESTYYGDGIVIRIEPRHDEWSHKGRYQLALANHHRTERKILKLISKSGYKLRIATSGYTATDLTF
jgi:hypothetical protein